MHEGIYGKHIGGRTLGFKGRARLLLVDHEQGHNRLYAKVLEVFLGVTPIHDPLELD